MRYDQLFTKLFCTPLALEPSVRAGYERLLLSFMAGTPAPLPSLAERQPEYSARKTDAVRADRYVDNILEVDGKRAIIHVDGAIDRHLSALDRLCFEAVDLNDVNRALVRVESDNTVEDVLVAINSPGGTVNGVPETAAKIAALAEKKNVFAFIDGKGCSAAYWLAAACDQIFSTPSSTVGSIGVYIKLLDESRYLESEGLKIETVKDGKLKAAGASWKPLTDDERAHYQATVNQIGKMFRAAVNAKRPQVTQEAMEGQSFFGDSALAAGLVDALVPDLAGALAQF
jgi:signal peptide peptidase SppA